LGCGAPPAAAERVACFASATGAYTFSSTAASIASVASAKAMLQKVALAADAVLARADDVIQ